MSCLARGIPASGRWRECFSSGARQSRKIAAHSLPAPRIEPAMHLSLPLSSAPISTDVRLAGARLKLQGRPRLTRPREEAGKAGWSRARAIPPASGGSQRLLPLLASRAPGRAHERSPRRERPALTSYSLLQRKQGTRKLFLSAAAPQGPSQSGPIES